MTNFVLFEFLGSRTCRQRRLLRNYHPLRGVERIMSATTFGSAWKIRYIRAVQILLLVASAIWHPQATESLWSWLVYLPLAAALFFFSRLVFARLTEGGLEYLRFGKFKFVAWSEVEKATVNKLGRSRFSSAVAPFGRGTYFYLVLQSRSPSLLSMIPPPSQAMEMTEYGKHGKP